jgi:hypothetical protein
MTMASEPKDKLDAAMVVANGPEDDILGWDAVDWRACEERVRRLRQRIFTASRAGGPEKGSQPAEVDASFARQHALERATGDGA